MKIKIFFATLATTLFFVASSFAASLSIDSPTASGVTLTFPPDFAHEQLNNPWDMDARTDLAEFIPDADYGNGLTGYEQYSFSGGLFTFGISSADNAHFHLLSPGQPSTNPLGKNGQAIPIDSTRYSNFVIRMNTDTASEMRVHWNTGDTYSDKFVRTVTIPTYIGWNTYVVDLNSIGISAQTGETRGWSEAAQITGLRVEPGFSGNISVDWAMLTGAAPETHSINYTFTAGGGERYSMFVDNDNDPFNGHFGELISEGGGTTSLSVDPKSLFPGTYKVVGFVSGDFATLNGNMWDMSEAIDAPQITGVDNSSFTNGKLTGTVANDNGNANALVTLNSFNTSIDTSRYDKFSMGINVSQGGSGAIAYFNTSGALVASIFFGLSAGDNDVQVDLGAQGSWTGSMGAVKIFVHDAIGTTFEIDYASLRGDGFVTSISAPTVVSSPGNIVVNSPPLFEILQPDKRGGVDYAATELGNPWNMDSADDLQSVHNASQADILPNNFRGDRQGDFFCYVSSQGNDDAYQWSLIEGPNSSTVIDSSRYKNMTIEAFVDRAQDVTNGSVLRIIGWNRDRDEDPFNGDDTIIQFSDSAWMTLTQDMTEILLEPLIHAPGTFNDPIWEGDFHGFRVDLHEFSETTTSCIDSIELRADDEANSNFVISFTGSDSDTALSNVDVDLYYTTATTATGGTLIVSDLDLSTTRHFNWDTSGIANGTYRVYADVTDGKNTVSRISHRVVINHSLTQDSTGPDVSVDSPSAGQVFNQNMLVSGYAIDDTQVSIVNVSVDGTLVDAFVPSMFNKTARDAFSTRSDASRAGFFETVDISGFADGAHTMTLTAFDTQGNSTSTNVSFTKGAAGSDAPFATPSPVNESSVSLPIEGDDGSSGGDGGGDGSLTMTKKVNKKKRTLTLSFSSANQCTTVTVYAHENQSTAQSSPTSGTLVNTTTVSTDEFTLTAKKLKKYKKKLFLAYLCDGTLANVLKVPLKKIKGRKKYRNFAQVARVLAKKLK